MRPRSATSKRSSAKRDDWILGYDTFEEARDKDGFRVLALGAPDGLDQWLQPLPDGVRIGSRFRSADLVLVSSTTAHDMRLGVERAMRVIPSDGTIWLCWPKKASGMESDLQSREIMMGYMLPPGLVDVKVAAVSDVWSGLKFVIRKELR